MSEISKKISPKMMGPKRLLAGDADKMILGCVVGKANGVTKTESATGEILEGLTGFFAFNNVNGEEIRSYILWLPSGMGADLFELPREGKEIKFAFNVGVRKAENPAGYEWYFVTLLSPAQTDPLAEIAGLLPTSAPVVAIEDKSNVTPMVDGKKTGKAKA